MVAQDILGLKDSVLFSLDLLKAKKSPKMFQNLIFREFKFSLLIIKIISRIALQKAEIVALTQVKVVGDYLENKKVMAFFYF